MAARDFKLDKRALAKLADDAVKEEIRKAQPHFDRLHRDHAGERVEEIVPHVHALYRKLGWKSGQASEIRDYAEVISRGDKIVLTAGKMRM